MSLCFRKTRNANATNTIISGPPTNSASVNCHPKRSAMMIPSSTTRFVEAISNAIAAEKLAPFRKSDRASATAAYEHDDDATPSPEASAIVSGRSSPSSRTIDSRRTTACTTAESAKPSMSAHRISHVIDAAIVSAWPASANRVTAGHESLVLPAHGLFARGCFPARVASRRPTVK